MSLITIHLVPIILLARAERHCVKRPVVFIYVNFIDCSDDENHQVQTAMFWGQGPQKNHVS